MGFTRARRLKNRPLEDLVTCAVSVFAPDTREASTKGNLHCGFGRGVRITNLPPNIELFPAENIVLTPAQRTLIILLYQRYHFDVAIRLLVDPTHVTTVKISERDLAPEIF